MASTQAADILTTGHPLLDAATGIANQYSNQRGLLNTTMGSTAATSAVANVAADLGKHQADMYGNAQQNSQGYQYDSNLSSQDYNQRVDLANQGYNHAADLSGQNFMQTRDLANLDYDQQVGLANLGYSHDSGLASLGYDRASSLSEQDYRQQTGLTELTAELAQQNQDIQNQFTQKLTEMGYDQESSTSLAAIIANQSTSLINNIGELLNNTDIEMGDNVTKWMTDPMHNYWESMASLLGISIEVV
jgi:hypothetical protein